MGAQTPPSERSCVSALFNAPSPELPCPGQVYFCDPRSPWQRGTFRTTPVTGFPPSLSKTPVRLREVVARILLSI